MPFKPHPTDPDKVIFVSHRFDSQSYANEYERGFVDGMQKQMQSSVDKAVNAMGKREWVGLTDEEISEFETWLDNEEEKIGWNPPPDIVKYLEAKLKEKNT